MALNEAVYGLGDLALLLVALATYDLVRTGRLHPATRLGAPALLGSILFVSLVVPKAPLPTA